MNRLCELQSQRQENLIFNFHKYSLPQVIKGNGAEIGSPLQQSVISGIISLSIFNKPFLWYSSNLLSVNYVYIQYKTSKNWIKQIRYAN